MTERPYRVICVSMYEDDLARLDKMVLEAKRRGKPTANRSLTGPEVQL